MGFRNTSMTEQSIVRNFSILIVLLVIFLLQPLNSSANPKRMTTKEEFISALRADEIAVDKVVWLKFPLRIYDDSSKLSSFTKLTIIDGSILPKYRDIPRSQKQLIISGRKDDGGIVQLVFSDYEDYSPGDVSSRFYLTDPKIQTLKWNKQVLSAIQNQTVNLGMTSQQVRLSWGSPLRINTTSGSWGKHEQWIYGSPPDSTYLYLKNNRLTEVQE